MKPVIDHYELKKRDELGLGPWRLMEEQKKTVIEFVHLQKNTGAEHNKKPEGTGHQTINPVYLAQPETKETCPVMSKTHPL